MFEQLHFGGTFPTVLTDVSPPGKAAIGQLFGLGGEPIDLPGRSVYGVCKCFEESGNLSNIVCSRTYGSPDRDNLLGRSCLPFGASGGRSRHSVRSNSFIMTDLWL